MFIRTVNKKNKYSPKVFQYQALVESIRTEQGPRHKFHLNLGKLNLAKEEWPLLARRIEEIIHGTEKLFAGNPEIERLASEYAQRFIRKYEIEYGETDEKRPSVPTCWDYPHPSSLRRTYKYDSLLRISGALQLNIFEQSRGKTFSTACVDLSPLHLDNFFILSIDFLARL